MQIRLYLDEDAMDSDLVRALRLRGMDVVTALDLGLANSSDEAHLQAAADAGRVLYSFNVGDFMALHKEFMAAGKEHGGIVLGQQQRYSVGEQLRRLIRLTQMHSSESMRNQVQFLGALK